MAHGLPDYYRGVDIAYQALAEMIVRPKYGAAQLAAGVVAAVANSEKTLFTVSGKGMVYGGTIITNPAATQQNSVPKIYCDSQDLNNLTLLQMDDFNIKTAYSNAVYSLKYDIPSLEFCVAICPYLTFETELKCTWDEKHGATPTIIYRVFYALV